MDQKTHMKYLLGRARWLTEQTAEAFKTEDDWFYQPFDKANYPIWVIGHLGLADNAFIGMFRDELTTKPDGWDELFWFGSELKEDRSVYPSAEEALAYFRERRETLLTAIDSLTDEDLAKEAPPADAMSPIAGAPNLAHIFFFASFHEGVHCGQLTIARRGLGNEPLFAPNS